MSKCLLPMHTLMQIADDDARQSHRLPMRHYLTEYIRATTRVVSTPNALVQVAFISQSFRPYPINVRQSQRACSISFLPSRIKSKRWWCASTPNQSYGWNSPSARKSFALLLLLLVLCTVSPSRNANVGVRISGIDSSTHHTTKVVDFLFTAPVRSASRSEYIQLSTFFPFTSCNPSLAQLPSHMRI